MTITYLSCIGVSVLGTIVATNSLAIALSWGRSFVERRKWVITNSALVVLNLSILAFNTYMLVLSLPKE